jgi:hypothetical protein
VGLSTASVIVGESTPHLVQHMPVGPGPGLNLLGEGSSPVPHCERKILEMLPEKIEAWGCWICFSLEVGSAGCRGMSTLVPHKATWLLMCSHETRKSCWYLDVV